MTDSDKYWHRKVTANPTLADKNSRVIMNALVLEKEIRKAFEAGKQVGFRQGVQVGKLGKFTDTDQNTLDQLFNQIGEK